MKVSIFSALHTDKALSHVFNTISQFHDWTESHMNVPDDGKEGDAQWKKFPGNNREQPAIAELECSESAVGKYLVNGSIEDSIENITGFVDKMIEGLKAADIGFQIEAYDVEDDELWCQWTDKTPEVVEK